MVNFPVEFSKRAAKYIRKLVGGVTGKRILEKIEKILTVACQLWWNFLKEMLSFIQITMVMIQNLCIFMKKHKNGFKMFI